MKREKQTKLIEWDGTQKPLSWFVEELGLDNDPDDEDCSYEAVYKQNRVE